MKWPGQRKYNMIHSQPHKDQMWFGFVCLKKKSTEKFIKTNCRQLAACGGGGSGISSYSEINKTLEKQI